MTHAIPLVEINNLTISFGGGIALKNYSTSLYKGEVLGVVGESGSGKSICWLSLLHLLPKTAKVEGSIKLKGRELIGLPIREIEKIRGRQVALISQDPGSALNPILTIERQIGETLAKHRGLTGSAIRSETKRLLDLVKLPDAAGRMRAYPHEMSGGQNQRILIAMALAAEPEVLIADEPTTALDVTVQLQILDLLRDIRAEKGTSIVLISHDLGVVAENCDRVSVMYAGSLMEVGPTAEVLNSPTHPYTVGLLNALPKLDGSPLTAIPGTVPSPDNRAAGCVFSDRCAIAQPRCATVMPKLRSRQSDAHRFACDLASDGSAIQ